MSFNLWWALQLDKGIEKMKSWIDRDTERLKIQIKRLTTEENLEFGYKTGHINHADYLIMKQEMESKK